MLLLKVVTFCTLTACAVSSEVPQVQDKDLFGPEAEDLLQERPLLFKPDEGHNFRRDFEQKHGYRGERLIAKLGGSPTPLSVYDASLIKHTTSAPVVSPTSAIRRSYHSYITTTTTTTSTEVPTTGGRRRSFKKEETTDSEPTKRKYSSIHRTKKERKSYRSSRKFSSTEAPIPEELSPYTAEELSPVDEAVVQKRLYRAIWNHGLRGLEENERVAENLATLGASVPPNFSELDLMQQLAVAIDQNQQQSVQESPEGPKEQKPDSSGNLPGDGLFLHALAQQASLDAQATDNPLEQPAVIEGAEPSLQQYAGEGQPSLLVASYSYSEIGPRPSVRPRVESSASQTSDQQQITFDDLQQFTAGDVQPRSNAGDVQQQISANEQQQLKFSDFEHQLGSSGKQHSVGASHNLPEHLFTSADQQSGIDSPIADIDDPFSGGSEIHPQFIKP